MSDPMNQKNQFTEDLISHDRAEPVRNEERLTLEKKTLTILDHVARLSREWHIADGRLGKCILTKGNWAQLYSIGAAGRVFSINLETGSIWLMRRSPPPVRIGDVRTMTGDELILGSSHACE
ncbi:MAG: hypothetical protein WA993_08455 [Candidatus Binatus sp.]|uniref:hypothetical protein n=1 Tax=Candidatus Binatus sp. TaxID=2811406 RepID=UPI003CBE9FEB